VRISLSGFGIGLEEDVITSSGIPELQRSPLSWEKDASAEAEALLVLQFFFFPQLVNLVALNNFRGL